MRNQAFLAALQRAKGWLGLGALAALRNVRQLGGRVRLGTMHMVPSAPVADVQAVQQLRQLRYQEMRAEAWLIGSGSVESAAKQSQARFAGPGMRWSRSGAERLLPVRSSLMSGRFDERWRQAYNSPPN